MRSCAAGDPPAGRDPRDGPDRPRRTCASRARHGVHEHEQREPAAVRGGRRARARPPAGRPVRRPAQTVDYCAGLRRSAGQIVESTRFACIEALAEAIAHELLAELPGRRGRPCGSASRRSSSAARSAPSASRSGGAGPAERSGAAALAARRRPAGQRSYEVRGSRPERDVDGDRLAVPQDLAGAPSSPGANWMSSASSGCSWSIVMPLIDRMTSPSLMPALAAGLPATTAGPEPPVLPSTSAPWSTVSLLSSLTCWLIELKRIPIHGRVRALPATAWCHDRLGDVDRDGEADAGRVRRDRGVDAHDVAVGVERAGRPSCPG